MANWVQPPDETRSRPWSSAALVRSFVEVETPGPIGDWDGVPWPPPDAGADEGFSSGAVTGEPSLAGGQLSVSVASSSTQFIITEAWNVPVWRIIPSAPPNLAPSHPAGVPLDAQIEWESDTGVVVADFITLSWEPGTLPGTDPVDGASLDMGRVYVVPPSWAPNLPDPPYAHMVRRADLATWDYTPVAAGVTSAPILTDGDPYLLVVPEEMVNATGAIDYTPPGGGGSRQWSMTSSFAPLWSYTYRPPRYRILTRGAWRTRQRQTIPGTDSRPLRQRQHGGHSGSWPLRQRQTGI